MASSDELTSLVRTRLDTAPKCTRLHLLAFFVIGTAVSMPVASFIAPKQYFMYKLRTVDANHTIHHNGSNSTLPNELQLRYESFATVVLSAGIFLFNMFMLLIANHVRLMIRMVAPMVIVFILTAGSLVLAKVNTDEHQMGFFIITIVTIFFLTGFSVVSFASLFGIGSVLPGRMLLSVLAGTAFGAVLVSLINIFSLLINPDPLGSALIFFAASSVIVLLSIIVTIVTFRSPAIRYYVAQLRSSRKQRNESLGVIVSAINEPEHDEHDDDGDDPKAEGGKNGYDHHDHPDHEIQQNGYHHHIDDDDAEGRARARSDSVSRAITTWQIVKYCTKKTWVLQINTFLSSLIYGICFPALASAVVSVNKKPGDHPKDMWADVMFTPVACFFVGYMSQFIARPMPRLFRFPPFSHWRWVVLITLFRFIFVILLVLCNLQPRRVDTRIPIIFGHDAWPIVFIALLSWCQGYFQALLTVYLPKLVKGELKEHAAILGIACASIGQAFGGLISVPILSRVVQVHVLH